MAFFPQIRWVIATVLGLAVVGFALHFPGDGSEWDPSAAASGAVLGAISGVIVGFFQWLLRTAPLRSAVLSMAVGIGFSHALGDTGAPLAFGVAPAALISALVLTGALALTYDERRPVALAASFVGWAGGLMAAVAASKALGLPLTEDPIGWATEHMVLGIITGLVWAGLTSVAGFPARRPNPSGDAVVSAA